MAIKLFELDTSVRESAKQLSLAYNTVYHLYQVLRHAILITDSDNGSFSGEIEMDESYFGGRRKGNRSLGQQRGHSYLRLVARVWGFEVAGEAGLIVPTGKTPEYRQRENDVVCRRAAALLHAALVSPFRKSPGLNDAIVFHAQRGSFGKLREKAMVDYEYWKKQGWLEPGVRYFVRGPVNLLYTAIGLFVEYMARRQIRKDYPAK